MKKEITNLGVGFTVPKQYVIDIEKVKESEDVNAKINAVLTILEGFHIIINDYVMTDDLKKFTKEM